MTSRVFALLVGINEYGAPVPNLSGCLNDVDRFHDYLTRFVGGASLMVRTLKNEDATRAAIIDGFRSHLGQAGDGDAAVFQFCGHGAQWASNPAFRELCPDGRDEGLVCVDSRRAGGFDLADKELAVLIDEVAARNAHVAVVLDCCHSGSGTRGFDTRPSVKARLIDEVKTERPLETYLDGHYSRLRDAKKRLFIPEARHILLSACARGQLAQESSDDSGVFTSTLLDVLEKSGGSLSYADLFVRCRAAVRSRAFDQDPQFETFNRFDPTAGFLGRPVVPGEARYLVSCGPDGGWRVECGAIKGIQGELVSSVDLALYQENDSTVLAGTARIVEVGPQTSEIELDFESSESARYLATITSLQSAAMPSPSIGNDTSDEAVKRAHVAKWERTLALQNRRTAMDASSVGLTYTPEVAGGGQSEESSGEVILAFKQGGDELRGLLKAANRTSQTLHLLFLYFSEDFGIHVLRNEPLDGGREMTLWGADPPDFFFLEKDRDETVEKFKMLVSTEKVDDFLVAQPTLTEVLEAHGASRDIGALQPRTAVVHASEWFAKDFQARIVRSQTGTKR